MLGIDIRLEGPTPQFNCCNLVFVFIFHLQSLSTAFIYNSYFSLMIAVIIPLFMKNNSIIIGHSNF